MLYKMFNRKSLIMNALDNVTVSFVIRESWWKQNGTTFGRLRITFKLKIPNLYT